MSPEYAICGLVHEICVPEWATRAPECAICLPHSGIRARISTPFAPSIVNPAVDAIRTLECTIQRPPCAIRALKARYLPSRMCNLCAGARNLRTGVRNVRAGLRNPRVGGSNLCAGVRHRTPELAICIRSAQSACGRTPGRSVRSARRSAQLGLRNAQSARCGVKSAHRSGQCARRSAQSAPRSPQCARWSALFAPAMVS